MTSPPEPNHHAAPDLRRALRDTTRSRSNKVSLTVDRDEPDWSRIQGLSMGATAEIVTDSVEIAHVGELTLAKFPQVKAMPQPNLSSLAFLKLTPKVISVLDYTKGFGHTQLVMP